MSFRTINIAELGDPPARADEPRPELLWLPIASIVIDDAYQRPLLDAGLEAVRRIAEAFTWTRFSPCMVASIKGGRFALIDGQHRTHAAALVGETHVPAFVVNLDAVAQAAAFAGINGDLSRVTPLQLYRAALAAGVSWAVDADRAVTAGGARLMSVHVPSARRKPCEVYAVTLVRDMVEAGKADALTKAILALVSTRRGTTDPTLWAYEHLRPWARAVAAVPQAKDLAAFHADLDLPRIFEGAERMRHQPGRVGQSHISIATELLTAMLDRWANERRTS